MIGGFALALAASATFSVLDGLRKHLVRSLSPIALAAFLNAGQAALLLGASAFAGDHWPRDLRFYGVVAVNAAVNLATTLLYLRAVKRSPLSLTIPYLAFTPPLLVLTAWIVLGETPTLAGALGIGLVALGAYLLPGMSSWRAPLAALAREPGSRMMLLVAVLWSVSSALDKWAVRLATPALYGGLVFGLSSVATMGTTLFARREELPAARRLAPLLAVAAVLSALALFAQYASYETLPVSYTIAIKRAGMLGSVLIGWRFFGEGDIGSRLGAAAIMVGGVCLIVLTR